MNFQPFCYRPDIVFEGRNKAYGAYMIRKIYEKRILTSLLIAILGFTVAMGGPILYANLVPETAEANMKEVNLQDVETPPEEAKPEPPVELPPPPEDPPKIEQIKFLPPEPAPNEKVKEDEMPKQDEFKNAPPSDHNEDGEESGTLPPDTKLPEKKPEIQDTPKEDNTVYVSVQQAPEFEGGPSALNKYLSKNLKYPKSAQRQGIQGKVNVKFIVGKDGSINSVSLLKGITGCDECNAEAIRVVSGMPKWKPGRQNGNAVIVQYTVPIVFRLND